MTLDFLLCKNHYICSEDKEKIDELLNENSGWLGNTGDGQIKCEHCAKEGYVVLRFKQFDSESDEMTLVDAIKLGGGI